MIELCFFCGGNRTKSIRVVSPVALPPARPDQTYPCINCQCCAQPDEIMIFEVTEKDPGCDNPILQDGVWFTGRWACVPKAYVPKFFQPHRVKQVLDTGFACLRDDNYKVAGLTKMEELQH